MVVHHKHKQASPLIGWLLVALSSAKVFGLPPELKKIRDKSRDSVVELLVEDEHGPRGGIPASKGTGFYVTEDGTILTASHVISRARRVKARIEGGDMLECYLVDFDKGSDLAALRAKPHGDEQFVSLNLVPSQFEPRVDDLVLLMSYPSTAGLTPSDGEFIAIRKSKNLLDQDGRQIFQADIDVYQISPDTSAGSSGGPVLNSQGLVIGVFGAGVGGGGHEVNFCVPSKYVSERLQLNKTPRRFDGTPTSDNSSSQLSYDFKKSKTKVRDSAAGIFKDIRSHSWGTINPNLLGAVIDDQSAASNITGPWLTQIAARNVLVRVINPTFGFSVVAPLHYSLVEKASGGNELLSTFTDSTHQHQLTVKSVMLDDDPDWSDGGAELFDRLCKEYVQNDLGLERIVEHPSLIQSSKMAVIVPSYSDTRPRANVFGNAWRFWRHYAQPLPQGGYRHQLTIFALKQAVFCVVNFSYIEPALGLAPNVTPQEIVERAFIAASFSFME